MKAQSKKRYTVSACERFGSYWDVEVIAESIAEARVIGVDALEQKGLINRQCIRNTRVHDHNSDVWLGA